MNMQIN